MRKIVQAKTYFAKVQTKFVKIVDWLSWLKLTEMLRNSRSIYELRVSGHGPKAFRADAIIKIVGNFNEHVVLCLVALSRLFSCEIFIFNYATFFILSFLSKILWEIKYISGWQARFTFSRIGNIENRNQGSKREIRKKYWNLVPGGKI